MYSGRLLTCGSVDVTQQFMASVGYHGGTDEHRHLNAQCQRIELTQTIGVVAVHVGDAASGLLGRAPSRQ